MSVVGYPRNPDPSVEWSGAKRPYDLIKEATFALIAVALLTIGLRFRLRRAANEQLVTAFIARLLEPQQK